MKPNTPASRQHDQLTRRRFLRGAGVVMALPWLESIPVWGAETMTKADDPVASPKRLGVLFMGNGVNPKYWSAEATDTGSSAGSGPDYLASDLAQRLSQGPLRWHLLVTLAQPGDPTNDATKAWPADRATIDAGTLVLEHTEPQDSGPCRDINYDPLVLPDGIEASDDPLLPARSAAYADSYLRRTSEEAHLPGTAIAHPMPETRP